MSVQSSSVEDEKNAFMRRDGERIATEKTLEVRYAEEETSIYLKLFAYLGLYHSSH